MLNIAIIGVGKIAQDSHAPAIAANQGLHLAATASRNGHIDGVPAYPDFESLLRATPHLHAVSLCTPPNARHAIAAAAIDAGLHVMLEKPPAATVLEAEDLARRAADRGVTLFTTWHSRCSAGVAPARAWLRSRELVDVRVFWKEDIRRWHPGQSWILEAGGLGVFDPGINALSILTDILPQPLRVESAQFSIPKGRSGPIAATLALRCGTAAVHAEFDFRQTGQQQWDIEIETDAGRLALRDGGAVLALPGEMLRGPNAEYAKLYQRFADLVVEGQSDVDLAPLQLVADAFLLASRTDAEPIEY